MTDDRLPKILMKRILLSQNEEQCIVEYNWASQLTQLFGAIGFDIELKNWDDLILLAGNSELRKSITNILHQQDIDTTHVDSSLQFYNNIQSDRMEEADPQPEAYLKLNLSTTDRRVIAACRLRSDAVVTKISLLGL